MDRSPQEVIEEYLNEVQELGNYESAYLFSQEGLPMAEVRGETEITEDRLIEMSVLFQEVRKMADVMGGISELKEIILEGYNRKKIVFRFFEGFDQTVVLALVIPPRKTYRGLTNSLMRLVQKLSK
ncbi:MAG: hypothetical protein V2J62_02970 [candidate division KSB1 bacterium]|jgi:predicted regulator of Ras-like GTPase activity (Roadblock/LC7/MglB family)|nr:hypothetical protein [candidate division KSB1 bacterium]